MKIAKKPKEALTMGNKDRAHVDLAEHLAETYFPHDKVQPLELAERSGVTHSLGHYEEAFDGLLELKNDRFHMYLNRDRLSYVDHPRARFTAAHELGHYFIDDHRKALIGGVKPHPSFTEQYSLALSAEHEADTFAAALLMPPNRFISSAKRKEVNLTSISELATLFGTSMMSTAIRYARSDVASVAVMLWGETERKWCWSSQDVWGWTKNKAYKRTDAVSQGSATHTLLADPTLRSTDSRGSVLSEWFPWIKSDSTYNKMCREEAMRLGEYGVITMLEVCE